MKTQEVPLPLRQFYSVFKQLEHRHNYITVFDDMLTAMVNFFTPPEEPPLDVTCFQKYTNEERQIITRLIPEIITIYDQQINDQVKWYDPFGDFYQMLASRGKQSALGQFFTPAPLVDLCVVISISAPEDASELIGKGLRVNDPACGSGRMLISYHANYPGNYVYGEDRDPMCCKMACINLLMHGCEGEIVNHNSLDPEHYIRGWKINSDIRRTGLPSIKNLPKEQSFINQMWQRDLEKKPKNAPEVQQLQIF